MIFINNKKIIVGVMGLGMVLASYYSVLNINFINAENNGRACLEEVYRTNGSDKSLVISCSKEIKNYKTKNTVTVSNIKVSKASSSGASENVSTLQNVVVMKPDNATDKKEQETDNSTISDSKPQNPVDEQDKVDNPIQTPDKEPEQKPEEKPVEKPVEKPEEKPAEPEVDKTPTLSVKDNIVVDFNNISKLASMASAKDYQGKDISENIKVDTSNIEMKEGEYLVTFSITDSGMTKSVSVKIKLIEPDTVAPIINGVEDITVEAGTKSIDYMKGVTAIDNRDGTLTDKIDVDSSAVKLDVPGTYKVIYSVSDKNGNKATKEIKVIVTKPADKTPPVIKGVPDMIETYVGEKVDYMKGVSATDNNDGDLTKKIVVDDSAVKLSEEGTYAVTYTVSDEAGNKASAVTTLKVNKKAEETVPPVEEEKPENPSDGGSQGGNTDDEIKDEEIVFAEFENYAYTTKSVSLKTEAKDTAPNAVTVSANTLVDIDGIYGEWYKVSYNEKEYYAKKSGFKVMFGNLTIGSQKYNFTLEKYDSLQPNATVKDFNPDLFMDPEGILQFLRIDKYQEVSKTKLASIISGKGVLSGKADEIIEACKLYDINPLYFVSHTILETGHGTSRLASGIKITEYKSASGEMIQIPETTVYNLFGIGAYDSDPIVGGTSYAYRNGWTSLDSAIKGAAKFISKNYVHKTQNTVYEMRYNSAGYTHQYATDKGWASKIGKLMYQYAYMTEPLDNATLEIPNFNK